MDMYLIVFLVIVSLVVLIGILQKNEKEKMEKTFRRQAVVRNGTVKRGTLLYYPQLLFCQEDTNIRISAMPGSGSSGRQRPDITFSEFSVTPEQNVECYIQGKTPQLRLEKVLGAWNILTGNHRFDENFFVKSDNEFFAQKLLSEKVQDNLLKYGSVGIKVKIKKNKFTMSISKILKTDRDFEMLIETTILFCGRLKKFGLGEVSNG